MYYDELDSEIGTLLLLADKKGLRQLVITSGGFRPHRHWEHNPDFLSQYRQQLTEYLQGQRTQFELPLAPQGTLFQQQVWSAIQSIPYGNRQSYEELAQSINQPYASNAIGMAKNVNPIPIVIPCHRVSTLGEPVSSCRYGNNLLHQLHALESGEIRLL